MSPDTLRCGLLQQGGLCFAAGRELLPSAFCSIWDAKLSALYIIGAIGYFNGSFGVCCGMHAP